MTTSTPEHGIDINHVSRAIPSHKELLKRYAHPHTPPQPGTPDYEPFLAALAEQRIHAAKDSKIGRRVTEKDVEELLSVDMTNDAGIRAREAFLNLLQNNRRKRIQFWSGWVFFLALVSALCYTGYIWGSINMEKGRHTVPVTCEIPFGSSTLEGRRHISYPVRSLLGYSWFDQSKIDEEVEVVLKGDPLIILGINHKGKPWRKEFTKGEFGVAKLPLSDLYWFVGKNVKETTPVPHSAFCK